MNKSRSTTNKQILTFLNENDYANAAKLLLQIQINEWDKLDNGYKNLKISVDQYADHVIKLVESFCQF